jgi:hypothetical protein
MIFRRLTPRDLPGILDLQEANLFENLPDDQRQDGFLSVRFGAEHFAQMDRDAAVAVAENGGRVIGYACCAGVEYSLQFSLLAAMMGTFKRVNYLGTPLADSRTTIYGPVCIDRDSRGRGVLRGLIATVRTELAGRIDVAAAFIAKANERSLAAHVDGLGMSVIGDFAFDGKEYWIVCFGIAAADQACGAGPRPG